MSKGFKRYKRGALGLGLAFVLGCGLFLPTLRKEEKAVSATAEGVELWTTYATEKVLRDAPVSEYADVKSGANVVVNACKGEYESTQLILSAKEAVSSYVVKAADLRSSGGDAFAKENILLYHEKYILVERNYDNNGAATGWYPDALLPMETAVAYGENKIAAGKNQGVYVTFNVPVDQPAGDYTGSFTVEIDGVETTLPVRLTVYNVEVSQTTHAKSKFNTSFHHELGELDSTQAMTDSYNRKLAEYRISPGTLGHVTMDESGMQAYVDKAYELLQNPKMSNFSIPAFTASRNGQKTIDRNMLAMYLEGIAKKSLETDFNLMERAIFSTGLIDEPDLFGLMARVPVVCEDFNAAVDATLPKIDRIAENYDTTPDFVAALKKALEDLPLVVSMPYKEEAVEMGVETFCPYASEYDTPVKRENYKDQTQRWWYTCIKPRPPFPSYHIEDTLLSARALNWMMSEYDVTGNFYWGTDVYARYDGTNYQPIEDYYQTSDRYPQANGDGFLFYPGSPYGLSEPVASVRLEAIRDGAEEYELFYSLNEVYGKHGFSTDNIQRSISSLIYTGMKVSSTSQSFYGAREALISLTALAQSKAEVCVVDAIDDNYGKITYRVFVKNGYTLQSNGNQITEYATRAEGKIYSVTASLDDADNYIDFGVEVDGEYIGFRYRLGGKVSQLSAAELTGLTAAGGCTMTSELVELSGQGRLLQLDFKEAIKKHQAVQISNSFLQSIDASASRLVIRIYNPGEELPFDLQAKFKGRKYNVTVANGTLKKGMNEITVSGFGSYNWESYQALEYMTLYLTEDNKGTNGAKTVYLKDLVLYGG